MRVENNLPLTETSFLILLSLTNAPKHGYAIIKDVETMSDGRVALATGTLYSALKRMLDEGWIERVVSSQPNGENRQRKYYQLSHLGRRIFEAETYRLHKLVRLTQVYRMDGDQ